MRRGLLRTGEGNRLFFWCPGCEEHHAVCIVGEPPRWSFNGDFEAPTFSPSVNVRTGHYVDGHAKSGYCVKSGGTEECDCTVCHSVVTDGNIRFLNDCTHALAGKTVPLQAEPN